MVFEHVKKRIIDGLIDEIGGLDAVGIELVGHNVLSVLLGKRLVHHGINREYKPSGYTVDSFSQDSAIVCEYSTEAGFFNVSEAKTNPHFKKIDKDIAHALSHRPPNGPDRIYLVSNREEPPSFRSEFNGTATGQAHGGVVEFFGARELAKEIYDQSVRNPECATFYRQAFPGFAQDFDNYEYYGKVPGRCESHLSEAEALRAVRAHFESGERVCVLHGLSGAGKTQAAIDFVHGESARFENYIWIAGDDWKDGTPLSSVQRARGGVPINVAGIFNSAKTILVVDGLERRVEMGQFEDLAAGFAKGGAVLVTSQLADPGSGLYVAMPALSEATALGILGEDPETPSAEGLAFAKACRFSPLILATTRKVAELGGIGRADFYAEVLEDPMAISGGDGISIMRRILSKLDDRVHGALAKIAESGVATHDMGFLRRFVGINACVSLQRLSILMPANAPGVMRVHDLVCAAVRGKVDGAHLAAAVEGFVAMGKGEMTPGVLRQIHLSSLPLLAEDARRGDREPDWLTYALLQVDGQAKEAARERLHATDVAASRSLAAVMSVIDAKEAHSFGIAEAGERENYYMACADAYQMAFEGANDADVRSELLHHRGKAFRRCRKYDEALDCFERTLELKPGWHAVHGQIVHLGTQQGASEEIRRKGERSLGTLVGHILDDAAAVPLRVSLATLARMRSYREFTRKVSSDAQAVRKLGDVIAMAALEGLDQFYEAFVSFTSSFHYHHGATCVGLAEALQEMLATLPDAVEPKQWVSACEALTNISIAAGSIGKGELKTRAAAASVRFANAVYAGTRMDAFPARAIAKAYVNADMPAEALDAIGRVPPDRVDHWLLYQKTKALLAMRSYPEALQVAGQALVLVGADPKAQPNVSSYHELLSKCHEGCGDKLPALTAAQNALATCTDAQYKAHLEQRVADLQ